MNLYKQDLINQQGQEIAQVEFALTDNEIMITYSALNETVIALQDELKQANRLPHEIEETQRLLSFAKSAMNKFHTIFLICAYGEHNKQ